MPKNDIGLAPPCIRLHSAPLGSAAAFVVRRWHMPPPPAPAHLDHVGVQEHVLDGKGGQVGDVEPHGLGAGLIEVAQQQLRRNKPMCGRISRAWRQGAAGAGAAGLQVWAEAVESEQGCWPGRWGQRSRG